MVGTREIELAASRMEPLPDNLTAPEQLLFLSLRQLYRDWRAELLTRDAARLEKEKVLDAWRTYAELLATTQRLCKTFCTVQNDTEPLRRAYTLARAKGADANELLALACKIVRQATGDETIKARGAING